jgi:hypothetical protein
MRIVSVFIIVMLVLTGCSKASNQNVPDNKKSQAAQITLTPIDMFQGEAAKFKPFLGVMSGAFKLSYAGGRPNAWLDIDIWKDGKKVKDSSGSVGDLFSNAANASAEVEVMISVEAIPIEGQDNYRLIKVNLVHDSGTSLSTMTIPWDPKQTLQSLIQHNETQSFPEDQPVPVFAVQASSANGMSTTELSEESLSKTEYALVFTLRFEEQG